MRKRYEEPVLEFIRLNACVITTSGDTMTSIGDESLGGDQDTFDTTSNPTT